MRINSSAEVLSRGMNCLVEQLGIIEAERFISLVIREQFDYTQWQRDYFDRMTPEEIKREASAYAKDHPFQGNPNTILL